jgi:hypothetical protein
MLGGIRLGDTPAGSPPALIGGSRQEIIDRLGAYQEAGLQHLIATPRRAAGPFTPDAMIEDMQQLAEEILPAVR